MTDQKFGAIILAAGKGTRMKSDKAKVLHSIGGKSMVIRVIESVLCLCRNHIHVVVGHQAEKVRSEVQRFHSNIHFATQARLLGTGDAVKSALGGISPAVDHVLVLCGDTPLIQAKTLADFLAFHGKEKRVVSVLSVIIEEPTGYGRIVQDDNGNVVAIREEADADASEKKIQRVNTGIYCFDRSFLAQAIQEIQPDNNQAEYYLTDLVEIAVDKGYKIGCQLAPNAHEVMGVNTLEELEKAASLNP